ncbi:MAG: hypothetical protein U9Q83_03390 [Bacteroidota bacterium]|nr:hypothetical protein [Bacteroidota bacterium]
MTIQDIIKQTESFTIEQKQQLAYYFFFATISEDKKHDFMQLFNYHSNHVESEQKKRKVDLSACTNLNGTLDNVNIREFAYE